MKKENRLRIKIAQFGYDHQRLERELQKVRFSTNELCKMLDTMSPVPEKKPKNEKDEKK